MNALLGSYSNDPLDSLSGIPSRPNVALNVAPLTQPVSVNELRLPAAAVKEFQRSLKAVRSGDFESAAQHLQKAIRIDPNFAQAHNNLGASYLQLNQYESAVSEFRKAIALEPSLQETHRNLGLGLFLLRRYSEAEVAAREALRLDPQRNSARYTLGRILAAEGSKSQETEQLLRESARDFVDARLPLAQVLLKKGAKDEAAAELRAYLGSRDANPAVKSAIERWLAQITRSDENTALR